MQCLGKLGVSDVQLSAFFSQIRAVQHVDVTMFSNGKFKNTIAVLEEAEGLPLTSGCTLERHYPLTLMENGARRNWVALEDRYGR